MSVDDDIRKDFDRELQSEATRRVIANLSHNLNNSFFLINGYADIALKNLEDSERVVSCLEKIGAAVKKGDEVTREMRQLFQLETSFEDLEVLPESENV